MAGYFTNGVSRQPTFYGSEHFAWDIINAGGASPLQGSSSITLLATALAYFSNFASKTTVAGTRYITSITITEGQGDTTNTDGVIDSAPQLVTGVNVLVGSVGGTDSWIVELHNSSGALVATSATAGTTAGTAGTWQQIPFTAPYSAAPGTYYIVVQSNGTTAHPAVYNSPTNSQLLTGSATGTFGAGASITPPTTYTAALGPVSFLY